MEICDTLGCFTVLKFTVSFLRPQAIACNYGYEHKTYKLLKINTL